MNTYFKKPNLFSIFKSRGKKERMMLELSGTCNHGSSVSLLSPRNWPSKAGHKTELSLVVTHQFHSLRVQCGKELLRERASPE